MVQAAPIMVPAAGQEVSKPRMEFRLVPPRAEAPARPAAAAPVHPHWEALLRGRVLVGLGVGLLLLFAGVTALVVWLNPLVVDVPVTREVQEINYGPFNWLMLAVSAPGFEPWDYLFPLVIVGAIALLRRLVEAAFFLLATGLAESAVVVKDLVQRPRPSADLVNVVHTLTSYSFPSGHVTGYTLIFGFGFYLAFTLLRPGAWRALLLGATGALVLLVGPSRIWMGQHWASDVLGGYTLGFGLLLLIIGLYRRWQHHTVRQAARQSL
jgi:membrane-associated phospholipid phosphatase